MPRNTITDLRDHLFLQIENLTNPEEGQEVDDQAIKVAQTVSDLAGKIIDTAKVELGYMKVLQRAGKEVPDSKLLAPSPKSGEGPPKISEAKKEE